MAHTGFYAILLVPPFGGKGYYLPPPNLSVSCTHCLNPLLIFGESESVGFISLIYLVYAGGKLNFSSATGSCLEMQDRVSAHSSPST